MCVFFPVSSISFSFPTVVFCNILFVIMNKTWFLNDIIFQEMTSFLLGKQHKNRGTMCILDILAIYLNLGYLRQIIQFIFTVLLLWHIFN